MSDDSDDEGSRRRDKFTSERTDRKRPAEDDPGLLDRGGQHTRHHDTPRPARNGRYDHQGFPKRSRHDGRPPPNSFRGPRMPHPGGFVRPMNTGSYGGGRYGGGNNPPPLMGAPPLLMPPGAVRSPPSGIPKAIRKQLNYDVMGKEEWKKTIGKDTSEEEEAQKYTEFYVKSTRRQMRAIFDEHKERVWFKELYHPDHQQDRLDARKAVCVQRLEAFSKMLNNGDFESISWRWEKRKRLEKLLKDINNELDLLDPPEPVSNSVDLDDGHDSTNKEAAKDQSPTQSIEDSSIISTENGSGNTSSNKDENFEVSGDGELDYDDPEPDANDSSAEKADPPAVQENIRHRPFSVELFGIDSLLKRDIEKAVKQTPGYKRLSIATARDSSPLRLKPGERKVWATFAGVTINNTLKQLADIKVDGKGLNFQIASRNIDMIRTPQACILVDSDKELAEKIIKYFDSLVDIYPTSSGLESNPVTCGEVTIEKMVLYLRVVHSYDFFSGCYMDYENGQAQRVDYLTIPNVAVFLGTPVDDWRDIGWAVADAKDEFSSFPNQTGVMTVDDAVDDLTERHTQKLGDELFLCTLSGKKFRGINFVKKHITTKHSELVQKTSEELEYFNNYVNDIFRVRTLPGSGPPGPPFLMRSPILNPVMTGPSIPPFHAQVPDPTKDEFGRDIPVHRRGQRQTPPSVSRSSSLTRNRPTYGDLF